MPRNYNVLFVKTSKTATETIRVYLLEYARRAGLAINDGAFERFYRQNRFNVNTNHIRYDERSLRHFERSVDPDLPVLRISSVRRPLERLYSHYCYGNHWFKQGMDFNEWYLAIERRGLWPGWECASQGDATNNYMITYMGVRHLDARIKDQYDLVFVKEDFEASLQKLEALIGIRLDRVPKQNVGKRPARAYEFDPAVVELFEKNNEMDIQLYELVRELY